MGTKLGATDEQVDRGMEEWLSLSDRGCEKSLVTCIIDIVMLDKISAFELLENNGN